MFRSKKDLQNFRILNTHVQMQILFIIRQFYLRFYLR